jgi:hypothetical protein
LGIYGYIPTSWEKLSDLKESHPLETAKYAVIMGIGHKPAFNWWVPHVLMKRDRIISAVAKRSACFLKRTHKFGIEIPVGVYMQAMITRGLLGAYLYAWMRTHTHVHMVPYGRRTDRGLKYLFVKDTGSGSVPLS